MHDPYDSQAVLVVDDHADIRLALQVLLRTENIPSVLVASPAAALAAVSTTAFSCAVLDLNYGADTTSGHEGLALVARMREECPDLPLLVMTAWGSVDVAVKAMQMGAADFIEKPWNNTRMLHSVRTQIALGKMREENRRLRGEALLARQGTDVLRVCESSSMRRVVEWISKVASTHSNVLLLGENGTGKSLFAREIHALSPRADETVIRIDMGSLSESRFVEDMFGEDKPVPKPGRFELAHGGSLILEEVASIPFPQQVKLLRVLEEGELEREGAARTRRVDVRVISTTNADLEGAIRANRFRRDLLYRLNTMQIKLPPLGERVEDVIPLARHFLLRECRRLGRCSMIFTPSSERLMRGYHWPGNVRELEHAIERAVLLATHDEIDSSSLVLNSPQDDSPLLLDRLTLPEAEEMLIRNALERNDHNLQRAADALGISRQALYRRIEKMKSKGHFEQVQ